MSGKYFEDLEVGQRLHHSLRRTVTEMDNVLFCALTMNTQPLHIDEEFAKQTSFGQRIVNGLYTLGLVVGLSVPDLTEGTIVANLGYDKVLHPSSRLSRRYDQRRNRSAGETRVCLQTRSRHRATAADRAQARWNDRGGTGTNGDVSET